jgi:ABC-type anion transport system duplicated permease subunit
MLMLTYADQGAVLAGFNVAINMDLLQRYRPSAFVAWSLPAPIFGALVSAVIAGDAISRTVFLSTLMVAAGISLASRRSGGPTTG